MDRVIIDVREPLEYKMGHVAGAINIPSSRIVSEVKKLDDVPKDTEIILYCASGSRSNSSMQYLRQLGFTNLVNGINKTNVNTKYL